jgi:hypothetical protein
VATKIVAGTVPAQPPVPILTSRSSNSIAFNYSSPPNIGAPPVIGYKILWNQGMGSIFTLLSTNSDLTNLNFAKSTNIFGGVTYEFSIIAINIVGDSSPSISLAILAAQLPTAPQNLVKFSADKTSISVSWTAPMSDGSTPVTGYILYWDNASGTIINTPIGSTSWQTLTYSQAGLQTNKNYIFAVSSVNVVGESPITISAPIITATVPG